MRRFLVWAILVPRLAAADPGELDRLRRAALARAGLEDTTYRSMRRRMHWAALLPTARLRASRGNLIRFYDGVDALDASSNSATWRIDFELSWNLDQLAYAPGELVLARHALHAESVREQLLEKVTTLYHQRRRLLMDGTGGKSDYDPQERALLLDEIAARLENLTGLRP